MCPSVSYSWIDEFSEGRAVDKPCSVLFDSLLGSRAWKIVPKFSLTQNLELLQVKFYIPCTLNYLCSPFILWVSDAPTLSCTLSPPSFVLLVPWLVPFSMNTPTFVLWKNSIYYGESLFGFLPHTLCGGWVEDTWVIISICFPRTAIHFGMGMYQA